MVNDSKRVQILVKIKGNLISKSVSIDFYVARSMISKHTTALFKKKKIILALCIKSPLSPTY